MRRSIAFAALLLTLAGCQSQGTIMNGGFYQSPYNGIGVDGPGPGVAPDMYQPPIMPPAQGFMPGAAPGQYQQTALQGSMAEIGMPPMPVPIVPTSQVHFLGLESLVIRWDAKIPGTFDSEPFICPATHDFGQGHIYRLKLTNVPNQPGKELYPTLEIAPTSARTQAFLAHSSIPIEFTDNDFDQVFSGNYITKVVYLPNPDFQGIAMSGVGTLVNTQLQPGVDPIVEASKRGSILAVIRMGNKDLSSIVAENKRFVSMPGYFAPPAGYAPGQSSTIPQNLISGVNIPPYGTPMTKTTTGIPGPP
ncbi:MAG: hypothetical protein LBT89_03550, partial [Planctomycetaceae bacterium]|nr:hypothetical protein [Planctomycetaceae bacterium]